MDALWHKDAVIYQLHVRGFHDSNGDGIGDFRGLIEKLDYIKDLGANTIWILPMYPSPLKEGLKNSPMIAMDQTTAWILRQKVISGRVFDKVLRHWPNF